ncbi:xanthine dehydrogenase accessory protein XdhC [Chachezhania antarctica]|uniref:xanthine dehydrogenase accessory protein XdhC n=1 Tax=Chachezhania antarctica TaxID=2340860 RepID=UPI000EADC140|nr:xanthine dehydrogenase accessory protein XdhC [Chachezhania antarctica]
MAFDLTALTRAVEAHGTVARVVVAETRGSTPREVGAAMLVWEGGQSGTIGGGALEFDAAEAGREMEPGATTIRRQALGPDLGQCCGGAVTLLTEVFNAGCLPEPQDDVIARATGNDVMPLSVHRLLADARGQGAAPQAQLIDGWMVEPVTPAQTPLWIWGAGHVGRALVDVLAPLPDLAITWIDTGAERFPADIPEDVTTVPAADPAVLAGHAPTDAMHLVLTFSHAIDLDLCDALLRRGFAGLGLIGSATKRARFRSRLTAMGHSPHAIDRITCPIGDPALGKHPQAIAVGVAAQILAGQLGRTETDPNRKARPA